MHNGRRIAFYSLPVVLSLCLCSLILTGAGFLALNRGTPVTTASTSSQIQTLESQNSTTLRLTHRLTTTTFTEAQLAQGAQVYNQQCAACHGPEGQGQFAAAPLEPDSTGRIGAPPHNETGHTWHHSDVSLIRYVIEGGFSDPTRYYQMPSFGGILTENQIVFVLAYIKTMWTPEQRVEQQELTEQENAMFSN